MRRATPPTRRPLSPEHRAEALGFTKVDRRDPDDRWWEHPDGRLVWIEPDPRADYQWRTLVGQFPSPVGLAGAPSPALPPVEEPSPWE